jgi:hypothetical protein
MVESNDAMPSVEGHWLTHADDNARLLYDDLLVMSTSIFGGAPY